jgi:hypothetical protein
LQCREAPKRPRTVAVMAGLVPAIYVLNVRQ